MKVGRALYPLGNYAISAVGRPRERERERERVRCVKRGISWERATWRVGKRSVVYGSSAERIQPHWRALMRRSRGRVSRLASRHGRRRPPRTRPLGLAAVTAGQSRETLIFPRSENPPKCSGLQLLPHRCRRRPFFAFRSHRA